MLSKQEHEIMNIVYNACVGRDSCLVSPAEILAQIPEKKGYDSEKVEKILRTLELDDYFDMIYSDRKGEPVYCISLHTKGQSFKREKQQDRRKLYFKIGITVAMAVLSFAVGMILKAIFS